MGGDRSTYVRISAMSRKLFAFLLTELNIIRIKCQKCGKTAEIPSDKLANHFDFNMTPKCSFCLEELASTSGPHNPFMQLAKALDTFKTHTAKVEIEFVLPDDDSESV